jgi:hypothetical protein
VPDFPQVLRESLGLAHQRLNLVLIDVLWRGIWLGASLVLITVAAVWLGVQLSTLEWQGPDLAASQPIIFLYAAQQLWTAYSTALFFGAAGFAAVSTTLWLVLEAYFRGGREHFWIFAGSSLARIAILAAAALLLGLLSSRDRSWGVFFITIVIFMALALVIVVAETLVRKDAVELWATDLFTVFAAIATSLAFEGFSLMVVVLMSGALILASSRLVELAVALLVSAFAFGIWSVFHSYLLVVRFAAVDIMRRNVGENV